MDRKYKGNPNQEFQSGDVDDLQTYVQQGADTLIKYAVHPGQAYAGFAAAQSDAFSVTLQPGVYLQDGKMHVARASETLDLIEYQPPANKKAVAIIAWGSVVEGKEEYRQVLTDLDTEAAEPQLVALQEARVANIGMIGGVESGDPQYPTIGQNRVAVAYVILSPTGIVEIIPNKAADLASLYSIDRRLDSVEDWKAIAEPRLSTIATDVANLSNGQRNRVTIDDMFAVAGDVARLKEVANIPDDYADYGADRFLDADESDVDNVDFLAKVEEGVRFSAANKDVSELALFSSINPYVTQSGGMILPKFTSEKRIEIGNYAAEQSVTQYTQTSFDVVQKTMSRTRIRWGQIYNYCTNSQWWRAGTYDPITGIFTRQGETFEVLEGEALTNHRMIRLQQFWSDTYEDTYWEAVESTYTLNGANIAQSFMNSQAGWLVGIDLNFTRRGTAGDVHVMICELTPSGTPDLSKTIAKKTVAYLDLKQYPAVTPVDFTPTYLEAGKRYAFVVITQGDHYVAMADGAEYLAGTFFYSTDGAYFAGDITRDLMFNMRFAKFAYSRVAVDMQPLNLDGGIAGIDLLAPMKVPDACGLTFQVQLAGGWVPVSDVTPNALVGLPPLLPLQVVFQGTSDLHAGLYLTGSQVTIERPRTTFKHISTPRILAAASDTVRIEWQLGNWDAGHHVFNVKLLTAGGDELPDIVEDTPVPGNRIKRVMTFNLAAPIASFQIEATGTTSTALDVFHIEERVDIEL